jgi:hypothetical protein
MDATALGPRPSPTACSFSEVAGALEHRVEQNLRHRAFFLGDRTGTTPLALHLCGSADNLTYYVRVRPNYNVGANMNATFVLECAAENFYAVTHIGQKWPKIVFY